jgi:hypothetical protein
MEFQLASPQSCEPILYKESLTGKFSQCTDACAESVSGMVREKGGINKVKSRRLQLHRGPYLPPSSSGMA